MIKNICVFKVSDLKSTQDTLVRDVLAEIQRVARAADGLKAKFGDNDSKT